MKSNRIKIQIIFALLNLSFIPLSAQTKLESWRDHLPFTEAFQVVDADTRIYCATPGGLFYFNKSDNTINKFTRVQGLSDIEISAITYSKPLKILLIGYKNGNLDIFENNQVTNLSDIKIKTNLGNKTINNIFINNSNAYISCSFGIVVLNLTKKEISDTYYFYLSATTYLEVFAVTFDNQFIYAATANGIRKASQSDPDLFNFASWSTISDIPNSDKKFTKIIYDGSTVYALYTSDQGYGDRVYYSQGSGWQQLNVFSFEPNFYSLESSNGQIIVSGYNHCCIFDSNFNETDTAYWGIPRSAIIDKDRYIWIADPKKGMIRFSMPSRNSEVFIPNGPFSKKTYSVQAIKDHVFVLGGGTDASLNNRFLRGELSFFENQSWKDTLITSIWDPLNAVFDPANSSHLFVGTWGTGILELMNHQIVKIYDDKNSSLQNIIIGADFIRIGGLAFDKERNLWATNSEVNNQISVRKPNGDWKSFPYLNKIGYKIMGKILITRSNIKWVLLPHGGGIFAFDERGTFDNANDDLTKKFAVSDINGGTISSYVYSMAEDLDGNIWVGTGGGPAVYYNPDGVFTDDNFYAYQVRIPRKDGTELADLLLSTETITAIAIDGANRKWFGTLSSGIYLMSADGLKQIYHFTSTNSPLLSNSITDIAIEPASGEVFIGTDQGLISFRSTASQGLDDFGKVYVFPDPVRPDYHGNIVISGMIRDANVKITDISGNLVYETTSLGGQAIWNGNNLDGKRAATGVYLVFCTNDDGSKTYITKLLFIH